MKISYCIATNKEPEIILPTIQSIEQLAPHDWELILCAPYDRPAWMKHPRVHYVLDTINAGSTSAQNEGVKAARGDWILIGADESHIVYDVNFFLDLVNTPKMQAQEYQVINMAHTPYDTLHKQIVSFPPVDCTNIPPDVQHYVYPVHCFPAVSRKTIDTKFDGLFFNPNMIHHYVDHWLGFYVSRHSKDPVPSFTNHAVWLPFRSTGNTTKWDNHDANVFCNLAAIVIQGQKNLNYTAKFPL